jgi:hypothetical protein
MNEEALIRKAAPRVYGLASSFDVGQPNRMPPQTAPAIVSGLGGPAKKCHPAPTTVWLASNPSASAFSTATANGRVVK